MTSGWYPGTQLTLELTRPDGVTETYTDISPARAGAAHTSRSDQPFGSVFVRKGATYRLFPGDPGVLVGDYLATIRPTNGTGAEIRTLVTVTEPFFSSRGPARRARAFSMMNRPEYVGA